MSMFANLEQGYPSGSAPNEYPCHWKLGYYTSFCKGLYEQLKADQFTDTQVTVGNKTFHCHKVVLSSMSPFFEAMYLSGMIEAQSGNVTLQDIGTETFELILSFVYCGQDIVTADNVDSILKAATMLQIYCLRERCEEFIGDHIDVDNCIAAWKLASSHGCGQLSKKAFAYIIHNFADVWSTEEFQELDSDEIVEIIKSNDLITPDEETVCEAVLKWLKYDAESRQKHVAKLFEHLRLPLMQPEYLVERLDAEELVSNSHECKEYIEEAKKYHLLQSRRQEFVSARLAHRNHGEYTEVIIFIGGNLHPERTSTDIWCYSLHKRKWTHLNQTPYELGVEFAICPHGNAIFVSGGSEYTNSMIYYLTTQNSWYICSKMLIGRRRHCMVSHGDFLYVLGGFDDDEDEERFSTLLSVERFGVTSGTWEDFGYLTLPVRSASASVIQGKIYVFGGIDGDGVCLDTIQCFDTRSRECTLLNKSLPMAGMISSVVVNQITYLVFPNGKVMKMTPNEEIEDAGTIRNFDRCGFGIVQHAGKLIVMGGIDSVEIHDEFIQFDIEQHEGTSMDHQLVRPMFGFGCVKATLAKTILK
ncbi:KLH24-like protein [Mya arenaria]|uniref:KLH24-like protein n=1 Tax=Mya arenaria TaxID=6604 RepID=A0ABY7DJQ4_MYAAR|nr:kelch-like protein 24 [Mya arenaria]WAQ97166.1 KLH24-like protein [Mya arenaria]